MFSESECNQGSKSMCAAARTRIKLVAAMLPFRIGISVQCGMVGSPSQAEDGYACRTSETDVHMGGILQYELHVRHTGTTHWGDSQNI